MSKPKYPSSCDYSVIASTLGVYVAKKANNTETLLIIGKKIHGIYQHGEAIFIRKHLLIFESEIV